MKLKVTRKKVDPEIKFTMPVAWWREMGDLIGAGVTDNVLQQKQADGSALKKNADSTRAAKAKMGLPQLALVAELKRFVSGGAFRAFNVTKTSVTVKPRPGKLRQIVKWVQEKDYVGWFGISKTTKAAMGEQLREWIKKEIAKKSRETPR